MQINPEKKTRNSARNMEGRLIGGKYRIIKPIGSGSFGEIYQGVNTADGYHVAVKIETINTKFAQLRYEAKVYEELGHKQGIPKLLHYCSEDTFNAMVLELLGSSLEDLFNLCKRRFSIKTILMLNEQILTRIEHVHDCGFIHRDIKPDNFLMGIGPHSDKLYLIDFGLSKRYKEANGIHVPYRTNRNLTGTVRYASINAQKGIEQSRRDDLESLGFSLVYFYVGRLPWQGVVSENRKQKYEKILGIKNSTTIEQLCSNMPHEFALYMKYCRNMRFNDNPDYNYMRQLFRLLYRNLNYQYDYKYDWDNLPPHHQMYIKQQKYLEQIQTQQQVQQQAQHQAQQQAAKAAAQKHQKQPGRQRTALPEPIRPPPEPRPSMPRLTNQKKKKNES